MVEEKYILLVEDNPDDVELTLRAFTQNRILNKVVVVKDGEEALDFLFATGNYTDRDINSMPTVILLDLQLPKIDGLEVLRRIKADKRLQLIPVVILTSSKEELDKVHGYSLGANSYIRKPVDFLQFNEAVKNLGLYWVVLNETTEEFKGK